MAERKFSPFPVLKGEKLPVYESLYNLNLAFESIAANIARLNDKAIPRSLLDLYSLRQKKSEPESPTCSPAFCIAGSPLTGRTAAERPMNWRNDR